MLSACNIASGQNTANMISLQYSESPKVKNKLVIHGFVAHPDTVNLEMLSSSYEGNIVGDKVSTDTPGSITAVDKMFPILLFYNMVYWMDLKCNIDSTVQKKVIL